MTSQAETNAQLALRRLRRDALGDENLTVLAYVIPGGQVLAVPGNDDGPYVNIIETDWNKYVSTAAEASALVKSTPGAANKLHVTSAISADAFLHIFDLSALPTAGAVPDIRLPLPGFGAGTIGGSVGVDLTGWPFRRGIALGVSSVLATFTSVASGAVFSITFK